MSVDCGVSFPFISNHVSQLLMVPEDYKAFLSTLKLDWTLQGLPLSHLVPLWRRRLDEEGGTCLGEATLQDHVLLLLFLLVSTSRSEIKVKCNENHLFT